MKKSVLMLALIAIFLSANVVAQTAPKSTKAKTEVKAKAEVKEAKAEVKEAKAEVKKAENKEIKAKKEAKKVEVKKVN